MSPVNENGQKPVEADEGDAREKLGGTPQEDVSENVPTGIHWTYREILRSKSAVILVIDAAILTIAFLLIGAVVLPEDANKISIPSLIVNLVSLKAEIVAQELSMTVVVLLPFMLIFWPIVAWGVMVFYNIRDRKLPRTPKNLLMHKIMASRAWTWPWSMMVGTFDFTALYSILALATDSLLSGLGEDVQKLIALFITVFCLVFAERRVARISRTMVDRLPGNHDTACALLDGDFDELIPPDRRNPIGRAKVATVIRLGVVRNPKIAALIASGIDLRTQVKLFSAFLNSAIHGVLSAISFGIAAVVANELGAVGSVFASGQQDELLAHIRKTEEVQPHFIIEVIAVIVCVAVATFLILSGISSEVS